mmetsp:Transcript_23944/g.59906  ORF Transcript_23944/g.59906 Transcript_23944/m.59906 type:complete len:580 (-) Transcript_23944:70-1809(-)
MSRKKNSASQQSEKPRSPQSALQAAVLHRSPSQTEAAIFTTVSSWAGSPVDGAAASSSPTRSGSAAALPSQQSAVNTSSRTPGASGSSSGTLSRWRTNRIRPVRTVFLDPVDGEPIAGYLHKQGQKRKAWKRRWFQLEAHDELWYYKERGARPISYIPLRSCVVRPASVSSTGADGSSSSSSTATAAADRKHGYVFTIQACYAPRTDASSDNTSAGSPTESASGTESSKEEAAKPRTYYLATETEPDMQEWIQQLIHRHQAINPRGPSSQGSSRNSKRDALSMAGRKQHFQRTGDKGEDSPSNSALFADSPPTATSLLTGSSSTNLPSAGTLTSLQTPSSASVETFYPAVSSMPSSVSLNMSRPRTDEPAMLLLERQATSNLNKVTIGSLQKQHLELLYPVELAVNDVIAHFASASNEDTKFALGDDQITTSVARLIRGTLCSAIAGVLNSHLETEGLFGLFASHTHVWDFFRAASAPQMGASSMHHEIAVILDEFDKNHRLVNKSVKYRSFVCLALTERKLYSWLCTLLDSAQVVVEYYREGALVLSPVARRKFLALLLPLNDLPFSLSVDFEWKVPV